MYLPRSWETPQSGGKGRGGKQSFNIYFEAMYLILPWTNVGKHPKPAWIKCPSSTTRMSRRKLGSRDYSISPINTWSILGVRKPTNPGLLINFLGHPRSLRCAD